MPVKPKAVHFNSSVKSNVHAINGDEIEKVDVFFYLRGCTNFSRHIYTQIGKPWKALNFLEKV